MTSSPYPKYVHPIKTVVGSFSGFIALHEPDQDSGVHSSVAIAPNINQQSREKQEWDVVWLDDLYKFRKRSVYSTRYSIIDLRSGHNAHYMYELALPLSAMNLPWIGLTIKLQSYFGIGLDASFVAPGSILQATTHFPSSSDSQSLLFSAGSMAHPSICGTCILPRLCASDAFVALFSLTTYESWCPLNIGYLSLD